MYGYTVFYLSIHELIDIRVLSSVWIITNNAVLKICVQGFVWTYVFFALGYVLRSGIAGSYGNAIYKIFQKLSYCFPESKSAVSFYILSSV